MLYLNFVKSYLYVCIVAAAPVPEMSTKKVKTTQSPADNEVLQNDAPVQQGK